MTQSLDTTLTRAYELIEADRIDEARQLLKPLLNEHPEDADLWWVYAHSVDNPSEARRALEHVKQIDPGYPEVDNLLADIEPSKERVQRIRPLSPPVPEDADTAQPLSATDDFDDAAFADFEDDIDMETSSARSGRSPILFLLGAIVVIALVALGYLLFMRNQGVQPLTPTSAPQVAVNVTEESSPALGIPEMSTEEITVEAQAVQATEELTDTAEPTATFTEITEIVESDEPSATNTLATTAEITEEAAVTAEPKMTDTDVPPTDTDEPSATNTLATTAEITEEATAEPEAPTTTAEETEEPLMATETPSPTETPEPTVDPIDTIATVFSDFDLYAQPEITDTTAGQTFLVAVCLPRDGNRSQVLQEAMMILADNASSLPPATELAGITLVDCEAESPLRSVAAPVDEISAFQRDEISERDFQRTWRAVG